MMVTVNIVFVVRLSAPPVDKVPGRVVRPHKGTALAQCSPLHRSRTVPRTCWRQQSNDQLGHPKTPTTYFGTQKDPKGLFDCAFYWLFMA